ncbi:MAG: OprO/OprP family phosphate-selective porin [Gemmataceae bacterium]
MCAGWGIPFHRTPLIVGVLLAFAYSSSLYADEQTAEMRALIKAQSDKLDEQAKVLADQARLIREQSEFLERQRQALKGIIPASIQPQESASGGSLPEVMETINLSTGTKPQEGEDASGTKKEKSKETPLKVFWGKDGRLMFKSEDRNFIAHIGGFFQLDASYYSVSDSVQQLLPDRGLLAGSDMRRARLRSDGVCWNVVEWVMEIDFSRASDTTKDIISDPVPNVYINNMYIGLIDLPVFGNVRVGHIKEDLSFYNASSGRNIPFMERPNVWDAIEDPYIFDNGIMMSRTYLDDLLYVSLGLFMTNTRTGAFTVSPGAPLAFDVRVCYMPIYNEEDQHWMNIGATGSVRANPYERGTELPVGQTTVAPLVRAGISSQVPNIINTRPFYTREGTQLYTLCYNHSWGPFSMGAQYDGQFFNQSYVGGLPRSDGSLPDKVKPVGDLYFDGGAIEFLCFLTRGDHRTINKNFPCYGQVIPAENFSFARSGSSGESAHGLGAWEVGVKYDLVRAQLEVPGAPVVQRGGYLNAITLGLNWYLNPNASVMANYIYTTGFFGTQKADNANQAPADGAFHSFGTRFQFTF